MKTQDNKSSYVQNEAHDWLGDCAENYVAYLFAKAGFQVFGASKWGADLVIHDVERGVFCRAEVRSTDRKRRPAKKAQEKLKKIADILVEVRFDNHHISLRLCRLKEGICEEFTDSNPSIEELRNLVQ